MPSAGTEIDFYVPSLDGKLVAVSLSKGGSESGDVHVYDVASGKETGAPIPRVNGGTAGGSLAWNADGSGFYYTRYPRAGERPEADLHFFQQVYFHRLGTDTKQDAYSLGKDFPRIAEIQLRCFRGRTLYSAPPWPMAMAANSRIICSGPTANGIRSPGFPMRSPASVFGDGRESLSALALERAASGKILRILWRTRTSRKRRRWFPKAKP